MQRLPSAGELSRNLLNKAVVAGLVSIGVPPRTAEIIAPYLIKILAVVLSFSLILTVALFAGSVGGSRIDSTEAYEQVDSEIAQIVSQYSRAQRVPERLLLGLAKTQTNLGASSPYDVIDRSNPPTGVEATTQPVVNPGIGDPDVEGQGLGPYLIRSDEADAFDPQSWESSTEFLAIEARRIADVLVSSGLEEPTDDPIAADAFWQKVVDQLPVVDTLTGDAGCVISAATPLPNRIQILFECELRKSNRVTIRDMRRGPAGSVVEDTITGSAARSLIVNEALGVAWLWGSRNGAESWEDVVAQACNNRAAQAGIFPLSRTQINLADSKDRCDTDANITAAARVVINGLADVRKKESSSPFIKIAAAGWDSFSGVVPTAGGVRDRFEDDGPYQPFRPIGSCSDLTTAWLTGLVGSPNGSAFKALSVATPTSAMLESAATAFEDPSTGAPITNSLCKDPWTGKAPSSARYTDYVGKVAAALATEAQSGSFGFEDQVAPELSGVVVYAQRNSGLGAGAARWDTTAAVERLSPDPLFIEFPFFQRIAITNGPAGIGARSVSWAIMYGGLIPGDGRAGTIPAIGSPGGGIGIAMERFDANSYPMIDQAAGSSMVRVDCGSNGLPHYGLPLIVDRWETMCQAALSDGVKLVINSSFRTMQTQRALAESFKNSKVSRVAKPGTSRHQKGLALDIDLGSRDGMDGDARPQYAWLHTIVGCFDNQSKSFTPLGVPVLSSVYVAEMNAKRPPCGDGQFPVKRAQTFGLVPFCLMTPLSGSETLLNAPAVSCSATEVMPESASSQIREPWHFDVGIIVTSAVGSLTVANIPGCGTPVAIDPQDKRSVALGVRSIWYCVLAAEGLSALPVRNGPGDYKADAWFENFAQQVASEAVLVAFCESGLNPGSGANNKYKGVFQMGPDELTAFGSRAELWNDAVSNITAAARYWVHGFQGNSLYEGWRPWAVVNTQWFGTSNPLAVPVIGRFPAVPPSPKAGKAAGIALPNWAIDPDLYWGPSGSCKSAAETGDGFKDAPEAPLK